MIDYDLKKLQQATRQVSDHSPGLSMGLLSVLGSRTQTEGEDICVEMPLEMELISYPSIYPSICHRFVRTLTYIFVLYNIICIIHTYDFLMGYYRFYLHRKHVFLILFLLNQNRNIDYGIYNIYSVYKQECRWKDIKGIVLFKNGMVKKFIKGV